MIWRRLLISSETSIAQLHQYIQIAFDCSGEHLHRFRIHGKDYGIGSLGGISFEENPHAVYLSRFRLHPQESFRYEYDFTARWRVNVRLEMILPLDRRLVLPTCSGGRGTAPGEEYAGALAYLQHLDHPGTFPYRELGTMAAAIQGWLDAGGDRQGLGNIDELREAVERVAAYQKFQPQHLKRGQMNRQLQALSQEAA